MNTANRMLRLWHRLHILSGWFLIYLAIGGALGFGVMRPWTDEPTCLPYREVFGLITSNCPLPAVDFFWSAVIGFPYFLLLLPAAAFAMFRAAISQRSYLLDGFVWLSWSIPLGLILWAGFRYWLPRRRMIAWTAAAAIGVQIICIGLLA